MTFTSTQNIKEEITIFLRNSDIISTPNRGVTTSQDTGTFSAALTHTLVTNPTLLKNVRSVIVAGNTLKNGKDYTVAYNSGVIYFIVAQTGAYEINYDQGSTDRIYPDFPQPYLKLDSFPRIAVDITSGNTQEFGVGANVVKSEYNMTIVCYDKSQDEVERMIGELRQKIFEGRKNFYYLSFVTLTSMGPLLSTPFGQNKVMQRNQDIAVRFVFEQ